MDRVSACSHYSCVPNYSIVSER